MRVKSELSVDLIPWGKTRKGICLRRAAKNFKGRGGKSCGINPTFLGTQGGRHDKPEAFIYKQKWGGVEMSLLLYLEGTTVEKDFTGINKLTAHTRKTAKNDVRPPPVPRKRKIRRPPHPPPRTKQRGEDALFIFKKRKPHRCCNDRQILLGQNQGFLKKGKPCGKNRRGRGTTPNP